MNSFAVATTPLIEVSGKTTLHDRDFGSKGSTPMFCEIISIQITVFVIADGRICGSCLELHDYFREVKNNNSKFSKTKYKSCDIGLLISPPAF